MSHDVFVSYAQVERGRVEPIRSALTQLGMEVFIDFNSIEGADSIPQVIDTKLRQVPIVLGCWSHASLRRPWVLQECMLAKDLGKLLPIALEPIMPVNIPAGLYGTNYIDLSTFDGTTWSHDGWQRVIREVIRRLRTAQGTAPSSSTASSADIDVQTIDRRIAACDDTDGLRGLAPFVSDTALAPTVKARLAQLEADRSAAGRDGNVQTWIKHKSADAWGSFGQGIITPTRKSQPDTEFRMRFVNAASFEMGADPGEEAHQTELPRHRVDLTSSYWILDTPCTQKLYEAVMNSNPSHFKHPDNPVERVSWNDAAEFIEKVNRRLPTLRAALPSEAQWELACRGGTNAVSNRPLTELAWFDFNAQHKAHPVRLHEPNRLGLYDMLGNVWEWCKNYKYDYGAAAVTDPAGPPAGSKRAMRGGSWLNRANQIRASSRMFSAPTQYRNNVGFRFIAPP